MSPNSFHPSSRRIRLAPGVPRVASRIALSLLLVAGVPLPVAGADSIFPDTHAPLRADQTGARPPSQSQPPSQAPSQPDTGVPTPHRSREEIDAEIHDLEAERADLLTRYEPAHPDVRAVERRLRILREQREMLERGTAPAK